MLNKILMTLIFISSLDVLAETKINGFFDARYSEYVTYNDPGTPNGHPESGFSIEDGAIYMDHSRKQYNFIVDLPFRRSKEGDLVINSQNPN